MRPFFDFIIFFSLLFSAYWMYVIMRSFFYPQKEKTTKIVRIFFFALLLFCFLIIFWGSFIEPRLIKITEYNLNLGKTEKQKQIKILFVSDFHVGVYKKDGFVQKITDKIIEQNPDLILFGGDYILGNEKNSRYLQPLEDLAFQKPMFAVTGNHEFKLSEPDDSDYQDRSQTIRELFKNWGIKILDNENQLINIRNNYFYLAGITDLWTGQADLAKAGANTNSEAVKILLAHNPDIILENGFENFDLILSGHTHGGQIRLPWLGSVSPIPDELGRSFDKGIFHLDTLTSSSNLLISSGIGETGPRARLFNRPEIVIINLDL